MIRLYLSVNYVILGLDVRLILGRLNYEMIYIGGGDLFLYSEVMSVVVVDIGMNKGEWIYI